MQAIQRKRIEQVPNTFNVLRSVFDVRHYRDDLHDYVVVTERPGNPGPSITNCAETACPYIARSLGLDWARCVFIEHYPADGGGDDTFDQIRFDGALTTIESVVLRETLLYAPLHPGGGWRPLAPELARALQAAGCVMSRRIGSEVVLPDGRRTRIAAYDGRRYYGPDGEILTALPD